MFIEAQDDGSGCDNWSYKSCKTPVKSSSPTNQHPVFLQDGCPSCRPTNSVKALKEKYHTPWTCLPQAHLGSSNFVYDHQKLLVTLREGCHASHQPSDASTPSVSLNITFYSEQIENSRKIYETESNKCKNFRSNYLSINLSKMVPFIVLLISSR